MNESLPLAQIHDAVLQYLRNRDDVALFCAQAVNAYVDEPRMTQDIDILSTRGGEFAEELRSYLANLFQIAVRLRVLAGGKGYRIYQLREPKNRHLVDIRDIDKLPPTQSIAEIRVLMPAELIAQKLISLTNRQGNPKSDTDRRDVKVLLLAFPELKVETGKVFDRLNAMHADERTFEEWRELVAMNILPEQEEW